MLLWIFERFAILKVKRTSGTLLSEELIEGGLEPFKALISEARSILGILSGVL